MVTVPDLGLSSATAPETGNLTYARAQAAAARATELRRQTERLLDEAQVIQRAIADARRLRRSSLASRKRQRLSDYARLRARLETMPVIEQAEGILMAQSGCGEAEAFDMLRQASQRSNVPVRDLAARIVTQTAARPSGRAAVPLQA